MDTTHYLPDMLCSYRIPNTGITVFKAVDDQGLEQARTADSVPRASKTGSSQEIVTVAGGRMSVDLALQYTKYTHTLSAMSAKLEPG